MHTVGGDKIQTYPRLDQVRHSPNPTMESILDSTAHERRMCWSTSNRSMPVVAVYIVSALHAHASANVDCHRSFILVHVHELAIILTFCPIVSASPYARAIKTTRQVGKALNQKRCFICINVATGRQLIISVGCNCQPTATTD